MAYTFGGTTGDDLTWTESVSNWISSNMAGIICGWYYPTTLTAGRALWSVGSNSRCVIASTTSEIDIFLDRTTDAQRTTSGLGLVVNEWQFIAVLSSSQNTGAITQVRVWKGAGTALPAEVTVNDTVAGSGNVTVSTVPTIGNIGATGTSAFQGDIARFDYIVGTVNNSILFDTTGNITQETANRIFNTIVLPVWAGLPPGHYKSGTQANNGITHIMWDLDLKEPTGQALKVGGTNLTRVRTATVNAVWSENKRPIPSHGVATMFERMKR